MTRMPLAENAVDLVQGLIQVNIDSCNGFREAAADTKSPTLAQMFRSLGDDREAQARELQSLVAVSGEEPQDSGSMAASMHRTWMDLRAAMGGGDSAVLSEAERGEDHIKSKYEDALKECGGGELATILNRQYAAVQASHDQVRDLRDAAQRG